MSAKNSHIDEKKPPPERRKLLRSLDAARKANPKKLTREQVIAEARRRRYGE